MYRNASKRNNAYVNFLENVKLHRLISSDLHVNSLFANIKFKVILGYFRLCKYLQSFACNFTYYW